MSRPGTPFGEIVLHQGQSIPEPEPGTYFACLP